MMTRLPFLRLGTVGCRFVDYCYEVGWLLSAVRFALLLLRDDIREPSVLDILGWNGTGWDGMGEEFMLALTWAGIVGLLLRTYIFP